MQLSHNDKQMLLTSLVACAPSGGGSAPWTLARKLMADWGFTPNDGSVVAYQRRAARELRDDTGSSASSAENPHLAVLNWPKDGLDQPTFFIGSTGESGEHLRDSDAGWPYSIYRRNNSIGGTDTVLCEGIQNRHDAELLLAMCKTREVSQ